ncbi:hypothetical protein [Paraburkholderia sp. BL17N1]|uniref:hypothetical protein n=1 Tax=Paraburkholderia sp. BL17N1 TaxID=1938798 RepID=UPI000EAFE314|nr:hypothetical protein [Paraburkholderia sp. BL17N1]RKR45935.1 hypothetical protein B0G82_3600 [Paraburkholderia sp. BL17N1]
MTERTRTGIALGGPARARIAELSELSRLSQNAIIESLILGVTDEEAQEIIARGNALVKSEKRIRLETNRALREQLATLTPEQQQALLKLAQKTGAQ